MSSSFNATDAFRRLYADLVVRDSGCCDERLIEAFAVTPREKYVGPGPWPVFTRTGYVSTVTDDPRILYQDILIGLAPERGINNGQPTLHAACLAALAVVPGDKVTHIGSGTGYYTAILSYLVGSSGCVTAFEIEPDLANRSCHNLQGLSNVRVVNGSGVDGTIPQSTVIYVNAGATHPPDAWLNALTLGGRLLFPLTANEQYGCMLLVVRDGEDSFRARAIMRAAFIPCVGARDDSVAANLAAAFQRRSSDSIRSLHRSKVLDESAWYDGNGWWLSTTDSGT